MFDKYSFKELNEVFRNDWKYEFILKFINKAKKYINEDEARNYYPKNLFKNNEEIEYYVFTNYKVMIFSSKYDDNGNISYNLKSIPLSQIITVELLSDEYKYAVLKIHFNNGETITLDNRNDTNEYHSAKYIKLIDEIFKQLS